MVVVVKQKAAAGVTEQDKLDLMLRLADEVAKQYRVEDPCELWGAGWEAVEVASRTWAGIGPQLGHIRETVIRAMEREIKYPQGRRKGFLSGNSPVE